MPRRPRIRPPHSITVTATGKTTVVPDVARVYLGVTANRSTVKAVREAGAQAMTDIIAAVKALGVDDKDIQTTNLSLSPQYGNGSTPKVVGYQISEQVEITVRDLDKAGDVVDAATAKGATDVNGISFEVADPVKAQNDARAAAVAAARASAQAMAGAGNVSVGTVISMTDATAPSPIYYGGGLQGGRAVGRRRDAGPARHAGPDRDRDGGLRDRLTPRRRSGRRRHLAPPSDVTLTRCARPPRSAPPQRTRPSLRGPHRGRRRDRGGDHLWRGLSGDRGGDPLVLAARGRRAVLHPGTRLRRRLGDGRLAPAPSIAAR